MGDAKKKLFIPRNISGEDNRWAQWNKEQPIVDGERINQYNVNTGRKDGLWIMYDNNGRILYKIGYKDGEYEGIHQTFYLNGKIQFDGQTKNNEFTGLWKMYYMNGSLGEIGSFDDGKKYGIWKWYYSFNNQLEKIVNYIDGKPDGLSIEYFEYGDIRRKDIYKMAKKIAYIVYDKDGSVRESMDWKDDYDNMIIKEQMENKDEILKSWINYYGSDNTANWELELYESEVEDLIENGGNIYRVLFIDNLSEVNLKDMGNHWTTSRNNVIDVAEINQQYYGKNKQKVIVIEGYVEPNSITIEGVDIKGNPHEKEVNIINGKDVKIKQIFEYVGKKLIPIDMNINEQIENKDEILKSFEPQKELNPKVWDEDDKLKKKIKDTLVAIGQEFHKTLEVEAPIEDIIFTGSLANYNWSQYSDVDLHVLIDFNKFDDKELIKKYFDAKKAVWNDNHDIKIKGYDVELYAQDKDEPHESTGIYSVMNDEWIKKPKPQDVKIDRETIKKKVKQFESEYNRIVELYKDGKYEETRKALDMIKDKIKKYRKAGLDKGGEMATENLVFKTMRRSGLMDKIYELGLETTDKEYTIETLDESEKKKLFIPRKLSGEDSRWSDWNKDQPIVDGLRINQYNINTGKKEGIWEWYYDNGKLEYKGSYKNGEKEGYWEYYHDNGKLWSKGSYKNGDRDGIWEKYYDNGKLWSKGSYKNGEKEGYWEEYYDNGQLDYKGSYKNGLRDGYWEEYHYNGKLAYKGSFNNGEKEGYWEEYWSNGQLMYKGSYKNGGLIKRLDESEKKKLFIPRKISGEDSRWADWNKDQPIKDGIRINQYDINTGNKEGIWEWYFDNGQLDYKGSYNNGEKEGIWEEYYDNGQLYYKGSFKNGEKDGYWEYYHYNGQLDFKGSYKNGKEEGYWEEYWSNGKLRYKGSYKNGDRDGIWEWYYSNGQLDYKGSFNNGEKDGIWEEYWSNGQLRYKGSYKNGGLIKRLDESEKKKLFIPRKLSGEDSRWAQWNKEQPIVDGLRINQYDINTGKKDGYWEEYYSDGKLEYKGSYKNGEKEGYWEYYYTDGKLWFKGSFNNGEKEGYWEEYHYNGKLWSKGSYKNGEKEGYWEEYWSNGQLMYKGSYKNGLKDGICKWYYYDNGQLAYKCSYKNGELIKRFYDKIFESEQPKKKLFIPRKLSGEDSRWANWNKDQPIVDGERINQYDINTGKEEGYWEGYHSNGKLEYKGSYKNGKEEGIWEAYHFNGKLWSKGSYKNGKEEGYWERYYFNGQLDYKGSYKNGEKDGIWERYYYTDGKLRSKGSYKNGEKEGYWEEYHYNGQLDYKGSFNNGKKEGYWERYYFNGQLDYKGSFNNGLRDGYWEKYFDNGKLWFKGSFNNGERDGIWEWYFDNGQLMYKGLYKNGELVKRIPLTESERSKNKLFTPKRIDERKKEWNEMQPTIDGKKINQYDLTTGDMTGRWGEGDMDGGDTTNLFNIYWDVFSDDYYLEDGKLSEKENVFNDLKNRILSNLSWDIGEDAPLGHMYFDLTIPLRSKKVRDKFEELYKQSEYTGLNESKISDNVDDILKKFKKNIGLDVGFLTSFGSGINALIRNISSLIKEYAVQPLNAFEITNLAIAMIVVYFRQNKSLKGFKNEMLSIVAFTSLMPGYSDIINSLLGNVDFMDAFMTILKSAGVYAMLTHFKNK